MKARVDAWRRAFSRVMVGLAAAAVVLMAKAGPASAGASPDLAPRRTRMTNMPEFSYQIREDVIDLVRNVASEGAALVLIHGDVVCVCTYSRMYV